MSSSKTNQHHNSYTSNQQIINEVADDDPVNLATQTMDELDWCIKQLENMQSCKTISDLASTKVSWLLVLRRKKKNLTLFFHLICLFTVAVQENAK